MINSHQHTSSCQTQITCDNSWVYIHFNIHYNQDHTHSWHLACMQPDNLQIITASTCGTGKLNVFTVSCFPVAGYNSWRQLPKCTTYTLIYTHLLSINIINHAHTIQHSPREIGVNFPLLEYRHSSESSLMHTLTWHSNRQSDSGNDTCEVTSESFSGQTNLPDWLKDSAGQVTLKYGFASFFLCLYSIIASLGCSHRKEQWNWSALFWSSSQFADNASS